MTDDLINRLDEFAERLLDDVEREPADGEPKVSLSERIATFKAITAYLDKRGVRVPPMDGKAGKDDGAPNSEPTILRLQAQVNRKRR